MKTLVRQASVISVRGKLPEDFAMDPHFLYVGRGIPRRGWKKSKWANPYKITDYQPGEAVSLYEPWIREKIATYSDWFDVKELIGRRLGCWCCEWTPGQPIETPCHAIVLATFANYYCDPTDAPGREGYSPSCR